MIKPRGDWLVIKPILEPNEHKTKGGIIIPITQPLGGTVMMVGEIVNGGPAVNKRTGIVMYNNSASHKFRFEGTDFILIQEMYIVADME